MYTERKYRTLRVRMIIRQKIITKTIDLCEKLKIGLRINCSMKKSSVGSEEEELIVLTTTFHFSIF